MLYFYYREEGMDRKGEFSKIFDNTTFVDNITFVLKNEALTLNR